LKFWEGGAPLSLILLATLLSVAAILRRVIPGLNRLKIPDSMVAGLIGLALGPSALGWLPINQEVLEKVVYHGLAVLFIAVSLQSPAKGKNSAAGVKSMAFGIPMMAVLQGMLGLVLVLIWSASVEMIHPGVGLMLPLGFSQGPGQALAMGSAWEELGMVDGGQLGLIMAAMGFLWCVVVGVPLVGLARRRGWLTEVSGEAAHENEQVRKVSAPGGLEPLTGQLAAVAVVYLGAWGLIQLSTSALADNPQAVATLYGFHFIIGALMAIAARKLLHKVGQDELLDTPLLARISALTVDLVTVSAIAAVQIAVVKDWWFVVLLFTGLGGGITMVLCLWLSRRAFPEASFEHALVLFGAATGTLATGLALLRILDPELRGPVPSSAVLGAAAALPLSAPLLVVLQIPAGGWPGSYPDRTLMALGALFIYFLALALGWRFLGGLRLHKPIFSFWPSR